MPYKIIKLKPELYEYIRKIGRRDFKTDSLSTPYILYLIIKRYEYSQKYTRRR